MSDTDLEERTRKRFARRQWARRWLAWRYVVAAVVAVLLVVVAGWLVYFSSWLSVQGADIEGLHRLSEQEGAEAAAVPVGEPLASGDPDRIRARGQAPTWRACPG